MAWRPAELAYCSNVHPGESLRAVQENLARWVGAVRERRGLPRMYAGLWLSREASRVLSSSQAKIRGFASLLDRHGILLSTLNGFPYGGFHSYKVKEAVYAPDWSQPERLDYTLELAEILAQCLPPDMIEGTVSTLPLGLGPTWSAESHDNALNNLCRLVSGLARLRDRTGRSIRVCLEMEPGCALERTDETIGFFNRDLQHTATELRLDYESLHRHLGVCYDVCHQAVMFETPADSLSALAEAGIRIGKIQMSCAMDVTNAHTGAVQEALAAYAEPRYLHQVRALDNQGALRGSMDLTLALHSPGLLKADNWRIHFHVPLQTEYLANENLRTTRRDLLEVLDFLAERRDVRPYLEVETYTWEVLPPQLRAVDDEALVDGLAGELRWLEGALQTRGLLLEQP
jgi:sugar phosphate isomerase/epimerase